MLPADSLTHIIVEEIIEEHDCSGGHEDADAINRIWVEGTECGNLQHEHLATVYRKSGSNLSDRLL